MEPGMSTGWPVFSQRVPASMGWPAGSARVAPLRCTHTGCAEEVGVVLLLHEVVADLVDQLRPAAERLREGARHRAADEQAVGDGDSCRPRPPRSCTRASGATRGVKYPRSIWPRLRPSSSARLLEVVRGQAVAEAARAGVEHHPQVLAVVLQLDEVVAAAQAAELALAAPGARVPRDVPVVVHRDAVPLGGARGARPGPPRRRARSPRSAPCETTAPRDPAPRPTRGITRRENSCTRSGVASSRAHLRAQRGHAAADVVADGAHGQRAAGGHHAADRHAVAVVRVRRDGRRPARREAARVLDLRAQALLRLREERIRHEDAHLAAARCGSVEARGLAGAPAAFQLMAPPVALGLEVQPRVAHAPGWLMRVHVTAGATPPAPAARAATSASPSSSGRREVERHHRRAGGGRGPRHARAGRLRCAPA